MHIFTIPVQLQAQKDDFGYITYVFKCLDTECLSSLGMYTPYLSCTRWPNWEHRALKHGEEGYVEIHYVEAGKDTWYDSKEDAHKKYKNTAFIFQRFLSKNEGEDTSEIIMN